MSTPSHAEPEKLLPTAPTAAVGAIRRVGEADRLAAKQPDRFDVGSTAWVTARFTAEELMPKSLWQKWLDESYALSSGAAAGTLVFNASSASAISSGGIYGSTIVS